EPQALAVENLVLERPLLDLGAAALWIDARDGVEVGARQRDLVAGAGAGAGAGAAQPRRDEKDRPAEDDELEEPHGPAWLQESIQARSTRPLVGAMRRPVGSPLQPVGGCRQRTTG